MTNRTRKQSKEYSRFQKSDIIKTDCIFCDIKKGDDQYIKETKSFKVIKNIFPYTLWDNQPVSDHILLIPKKHVDSISTLSAQEAVEFVDILGSYEIQGYNIWARAPQSIIKSIVHQHTHLIKPINKKTKFIFYLLKPYFRISK